MGFQNCPKCDATICECGFMYRGWRAEELREQIAMLERVLHAVASGKTWCQICDGVMDPNPATNLCPKCVDRVRNAPTIDRSKKMDCLPGQLEFPPVKMEGNRDQLLAFIRGAIHEVIDPSDPSTSRTPDCQCPKGHAAYGVENCYPKGTVSWANLCPVCGVLYVLPTKTPEYVELTIEFDERPPAGFREELQTALEELTPKDTDLDD